MNLTRRDAIALSGSTVAGVSLGLVAADELGAQTPPAGQAAQEWPATLVERPVREGFPAELPLNPDGSAPEHDPSEAGPITQPLMWRTPDRTTPVIEYDYARMAIRVDTRGLARRTGTLHFSGPRALAARERHVPHAMRRPEPARDREVDGGEVQ